MWADQGEACHAWRSPGGTTSTWPLRINDRSPLTPSSPATSTASVRSTSIPGKRGCPFNRGTSASNWSTSKPASSSTRATRSWAARSSPVTEGTRIRSCARRTHAPVSSACRARASARSPIISSPLQVWELLLAEEDEVIRNAQQAAQAVDEVPEGCADRSALPEQIEEQQQRQHAEAVGENPQLDREPGRDDAESIERRDRDQVQDDGGELQEHQESEGSPEVDVAEGR